jgi:hypothetical protein
MIMKLICLLLEIQTKPLHQLDTRTPLGTETQHDYLKPKHHLLAVNLAMGSVSRSQVGRLDQLSLSKDLRNKCSDQPLRMPWSTGG